MEEYGRGYSTKALSPPANPVYPVIPGAIDFNSNSLFSALRIKRGDISLVVSR